MSRIYLYSIVLLLLYSSCRNDTINPDPQPCDLLIPLIPFSDTCFATPLPPGPGWFELYDPEKYENGQPDFDLSNPYKFLYYLAKTSGGISYWTVDLCKGEKKKIGDDDFGGFSGFGRPRLGPRDWIVYTTNGLELMVRKLNGDSLMHLVPGWSCKFPQWIDGDKIICEGVFPEPLAIHTLIVNLQGEVLDTLTPCGRPSWYNNKIACDIGYFGEKKIGYLDMENDYELVELFALPQENQQAGSIEWSDNNHIIWTDKIGLHQIDIETGDMTTLKENCDNRIIISVSSSPLYDGTVIMHEIHYWPVDTTNFRQEVERIYKYDTNTGEQWLIDLAP